MFLLIWIKSLAKVIVDASGCPSVVKKDIGLKQGLFGVGYQETLEESNSFVLDMLKIIYFKEFGYYWIFPRNPEKREINLGVGIFGDF